MLCLLVSYFPELSFAGPVYEVNVNEACPPDPDVIAEQLRQEQAETEAFLRGWRRTILARQIAANLRQDFWGHTYDELRLFDAEGQILMSDDEDDIL
ncbi:MAG: hypothetical protein LBB44_02995 [Endomicrobium sp.]|jgi:hypothetical protein|nr:hypothetical protein [Endomicrobium sp.]